MGGNSGEIGRKRMRMGVGGRLEGGWRGRGKGKGVEGVWAGMEKAKKELRGARVRRRGRGTGSDGGSRGGSSVLLREKRGSCLCPKQSGGKGILLVEKPSQEKKKRKSVTCRGTSEGGKNHLSSGRGGEKRERPFNERNLKGYPFRKRGGKKKSALDKDYPCRDERGSEEGGEEK